MNRWGLTGILLLLAVVAVSTVGCADPNKQKLAEMNASYNKLLKEKQALQDELDTARGTESQLRTEIASKDQKINVLETRLSTRPAVAPTAGTATGWERGLTGDRITVGSDLLFAAGKATLTRAGQGTLSRIAGTIKSQYAGLPVRVYGYTDTDPIRKTKHLWKDNLDLSANRAMAVTRYLIQQGVDAKRVETIAMGENHPASTKAKSRRVEIVVIKNR